jgi:ribosome biogenesis protein YTM1
MSNDVASQPVSFFTQTQYPIPSQKFMIPTSWKRFQLSQLINKTLVLENPVPFDFLVRGEILRASLSAWCANNGVGEVRSCPLGLSFAATELLMAQEETLEIEYIESVMPPKRMSDIPHEDWVSSVSCQLQGYV